MRSQRMFQSQRASIVRPARFWRALAAVGCLAALALSTAASADCCRVVRVDPESAGHPVQVCEPTADGQCGTVLFNGTIGLGDGENLCSYHDTIVYREFDADLGAFGSEVEAVCEGGDVEI